MNTFKTAKGTELPVLNLKGKDYLEVKYRLIWFREEHPDWTIETQLVAAEDKSAMMKATVKDESGRVLATSHKVENAAGFPDYLEKAETGAIGRALALCGYGTQFAHELEEGERIVDAPVQRGTPLQTGHLKPVQTQHTGGVYTIGFGKYRGKTFADIHRDELMNYLSYLETSATAEKPLSESAKGFITAADAYLSKTGSQGSLPSASASVASGTGLKEMPRMFEGDLPAFHADDVPF